MSDVITRKRVVIDSAQWIDSSNGEIVEAVKLEHLGAVPLDDLAEAAHALNGAMEARDAATAHVRELEGQLSAAWDEAPQVEAPMSLADAVRALRIRAVRLRSVIDACAEASGGSTAGASDEFAALVPGEIKAMRVSLEKRASEAEASVKMLGNAASKLESDRDALRAKLGEAEHASEQWRSRIASAVGAVHEWDYGSAPGTWEQIEDKAASDRKQADATLDEMIVYRDKCEALESRLTRYAAQEVGNV